VKQQFQQLSEQRLEKDLQYVKMSKPGYLKNTVEED